MIFDWFTTVAPSRMNMSIVTNTFSFTSKTSGATQTRAGTGSRWRMNLSYDNLDDAESRELEALYLKLNGMAGRVRCYDFGREPPVLLGAPVIKGANQMGTSVVTSGWTPSKTVLNLGDYIMIGDEMKMVTAVTKSNAAGEATIEFAPHLRRPPADKSKISADAKAVFMLDSNTNGVDRAPAFSNSFTFTLIEDIL